MQEQSNGIRILDGDSLKMRINVSVKPNMNFATQLTTACSRAMDRTIQAVLDDIKARAVVPKDTGELERSGFVQKVDEMTYAIIFSTPYARRWYFNVEKANFQKTKNVNAMDHWMDYYLDGEGKQWVLDTFVKFLKEEGRGLIV